VAAPRAVQDTALLEAVRGALPFELTGAQDRAMGQIVADMAKPIPMMRLLQVASPAYFPPYSPAATGPQFSSLRCPAALERLP